MNASTHYDAVYIQYFDLVTLLAGSAGITRIEHVDQLWLLDINVETYDRATLHETQLVDDVASSDDKYALIASMRDLRNTDSAHETQLMGDATACFHHCLDIEKKLMQHRRGQQ